MGATKDRKIEKEEGEQELKSGMMIVRHKKGRKEENKKGKAEETK